MNLQVCLMLVSEDMKCIAFFSLLTDYEISIVHVALRNTGQLE